MGPFLKTWQRSALLLVTVGAAIALAWGCTRDSKTNFLSRDHRAQWIVFPVAPDGHAHPVINVDTIFRRVFTLVGQPRTAQLQVRGAKRVQLRINGSAVETNGNRNWKRISTLDVARWLRTGPNTIEARVFNDDAPPALWLALTTEQLKLQSDESWLASLVGSTWRNSALASAPRFPRAGNLLAGGETTVGAIGRIWPMWLALGGLAFLLWWATHRWRHHLRVAWLPFIVAAVWIALLWNNAGRLSHHTGFDAQAHLDYIKYVQERRALPLPTEGFEMFQPPLYYVLSAATLSGVGLSANDPSGILVLRFLTTLFGIAHFSLVFLSMRWLSPNQIGRQSIGLLIAGFLPMQLYLSHYPTNETLAAALTTAALYLGLRLLRTEVPFQFGYGALGLALGAAILTKTTAVLLLPLLLAALAIKLARQRSSFATWMRTVGLMLAVCLLVCGWNYVRIWIHFGTPFVGNWEAAVGPSWWQEPGYHTFSDYVRFGRSLIDPLFSGFAGPADGIYSTLWGDGLCSGWDSIYRPPWNYDPMIAGYLLALAPTLLIVLGAAVAVYQFIRQPSTGGFLLLGFSGTMLFAVIMMTLKLAYYSQAKAFYGLSALLPLCFFGAVGWDVLTRRRKFFQFALGAILIIWALNSFGSFWIVPSASQHVYTGRHLRLADKLDAAAAEADAAVEADPSSAAARSFLAGVLNDLRRPNEAAEEAERAIKLNSSDSDSHLQLATALARQGQLERAIIESHRALEFGPENAFAYNLLLNCLLQTGHETEAIEVARDALTLSPFSPELHYNLGSAATGVGDFFTGSIHFGYAVLLRPGWTQAHAKFHDAIHSIGNGSDAAKQLQELAALAPDSPQVLEELAMIRANLSEP